MEVIAYHEAGHAVVACRFGAIVRRLTIEPEWDDAARRSGDTQVAWPLNHFSDRQRRLHSATVALAGPVAEMLYTGGPLLFDLQFPGESPPDLPLSDLQQAWSGDWRQAQSEIAPVFNNQQQQARFLRGQVRELREFLDARASWSAVAALADELLTHETLYEEQIAAVVRQWLAV